jgi:ribulose-5-phosphate 4-epimerase/fuculose-1-phosphate aldolase
MLEKLKEKVYKANLDLVDKGLVIHTWGNVSGRDKESGFIVIKPSGVSYDLMNPEHMVVIDRDGRVIEGKFKPSTDTHSSYATSWAQAGRAIPPFGTTHADHYYGEVPCTRLLTKKETETEYEINTGKIIVERLGDIDPLTVPSVLVNGHGPFCWGTNAENAVYNAVALEEIAKMAFYTVLLGKTEPISQYLLDKHFKRKHGNDAYYGQDKK